jgi:hypothetical protein
MKYHYLYNPTIPGFLSETVKCHCLCRVVETMTFISFRQEAWNDRVVETMTFNSFRQEGWNDRVVETMTFKGEFIFIIFLGFLSETVKCYCLYNPIIPGFLSETVKCYCLCNPIIPGFFSEAVKCNGLYIHIIITFSSFRQEA